MYQLKCIHPPGGATAFTAVLGGSSIAELGFVFARFPGADQRHDHGAAGRRYQRSFLLAALPGHPQPAPPSRGSAREEARKHEEILIALRAIDSFVDITEDDLVYLAELLSKRA